MKGISVVIPTYNRSKLLVRALRSVVEQSLACDEIIVIDDGSTDSTKQYVEEFSTFNTIEVRYYHQKNKGPAAARNYGIRKAKYNVLAFLDSDDHWHKKKLALQFKAFEANPNMMISHTRETWYRRGKHLNQKKKHQPQNGDIFEHCLQLCAVGMSTVMVRKEFFMESGFFNEEYRCCEDYDLWIRASCNHPFLLIDEPLTIKEGGRKDQVSFQYRVGMDKLRIASIQDLLESDQLSAKQHTLALLELCRKCKVYGKGCLKHDKIEEGNKYLEIAKFTEKLVRQ